MTASASTLVVRGSCMTNLFHGNAVLSAFQMARGYALSILVITYSVVSQDILDYHIDTTEIRALQKVQRTNNNGVEPHTAFVKGDREWFLQKSSQQNIPIGSVEAHVVEAKYQSLKCRSKWHGPPMNDTYEHANSCATRPEGRLYE